ncbi:MAG: hypothetical protein RMJ98_15015, partial [Myxococcales bacterium]|nr:hypothetical protein [Polyangiaceae bacterium]MDW8250603.1 hypothetical protein [Myxococcales bacterium]
MDRPIFHLSVPGGSGRVWPESRWRRILPGMRRLACLFLVLSACSANKEEKPPISDCQENCASTVISGGNSAGGGGSAGATGQSGNPGSAGSSLTGVSLQGTVVVHSDTTFSNPSVYTQAALLSGAPADVNQPPVANWLGSGTFTLNQVASGASWLKAIPTALADVTLGGLLQLTLDPNALPTDLNLPVVDTGVITTILGLLPGSPTINTDAAHAVITFVSSAGAPLAGVKVQPSFGAIVAYDSGSQFNDTNTGSRGQALMLNAQSSPGASLTYTTSAGKSGT